MSKKTRKLLKKLRRRLDKEQKRKPFPPRLDVEGVKLVWSGEWPPVGKD